MLAAGLGLGLVVGLSLAELTSTLVAALHVGSERLLAGFDALSGSDTLELLRSRRIQCFVWGLTRSNSGEVVGFRSWLGRGFAAPWQPVAPHRGAP